MPTRTNRRIVLASRPEGAPQPSNFRLEQSPAPVKEEDGKKRPVLQFEEIPKAR